MSCDKELPKKYPKSLYKDYPITEYYQHKTETIKELGYKMLPKCVQFGILPYDLRLSQA